jgi:hypothetical protein
MSKRIGIRRCKIEKLHRELKHLTAREACQCRKALIQINHIVCAILGWNFIKINSALDGKNSRLLKAEITVRLPQTRT